MTRTKQKNIPLIDDVIDVRCVVKNASVMVGSLALFSLLMGIGSDIVIIHPLIAGLLIIGSLGFYLMALVKTKGTVDDK